MNHNKLKRIIESIKVGCPRCSSGHPCTQCEHLSVVKKSLKEIMVNPPTGYLFTDEYRQPVLGDHWLESGEARSCDESSTMWLEQIGCKLILKKIETWETATTYHAGQTVKFAKCQADYTNDKVGYGTLVAQCSATKQYFVQNKKGQVSTYTIAKVLIK